MSQSIRVLIGDDSLELGISWATAFKEAGMYAITRPKSGKVLVEYVLTERPAVVILDAKTPGLDVCDIIKTIKSNGDYSPVVFVTANYDSAKVEFEVMDAGADYYMPVRSMQKRLYQKCYQSITTSLQASITRLLTNRIWSAL